MLRNPHRTGLIGALAASILVVALVAGCGGEDSSSSSPAGAQATGATDDGGMRTVRVYSREPSSPSPSATNLHAGLEEGRLPNGPVVATVLTDEDCAPDGQGISHCRNEARLPNGQIVVLRHPHAMHQVPCLAPGEMVRLRRA